MEEGFQLRFAYALRAAMTARGMNATTLAREIHRDPSTVRRWAEGQSIPNMLVLNQLANALRVKPELFYNPPAIPDYPIDDYLL